MPSVRKKKQDVTYTPVERQLRADRPPLPPDWDLSHEDLLPVLQELWGFDSFRPGQEDAMRRVLARQSTLMVQSTGSGKSLCFQLPAALLASRYRTMVVVISPLLSLVDDQIRSLPPSLVGAALHSGQAADKAADAKASINKGEVDLLYLSPETLATDWCRRLLQHPDTPRVAFACVDEAHCVSEWSHNFRPAYLRLQKTLTAALDVRTLLALTATATRLAEASICAHLGIPTAASGGVVRSFRIPANLQLTVSRTENKLDRLVHLLRNHHQMCHGSAIVYCGRQAETEYVAGYLRRHEVDARAFHAGMQPQAKRSVQNKFKKGQLRAVVATIAFGMGLDMHTVRCVVHFNFPKSPENYVQEVGRAGRDGAPAFGHLFVDDEDLFIHRCHVHADAVDRFTVFSFVRTMLRQLREADTDGGDLACRVASAVAGVGPAGESLLKVASARRAGRHRGGVVVLDLDALAQQLDVRESVLETFISSLEQHSGRLRASADDEDELCVEQLAACAAAVTLIVKQPAYAASDPLLAALLEVATQVEFEDGGGRGAYRRRAVAAASVRVDSTALAAVANVVGMDPKDIVRSLFGMSRAGVLSLEETGRAACVRLSRMPESDDVDVLCKTLLTTVRTLEHTQLAKLKSLQTVMHTALAQEPDWEDEQDTKSAAMDRFLRAALEGYFDAETPIDLGVEVDGDMEPRVDVESSEYDAVRPNLRHFVAQHAAGVSVRGGGVWVWGAMGSRRESRGLRRRFSLLLCTLAHSVAPLQQLTGRAIARICHGISSPAFPMSVWRNDGLWKRFADVDFYVLRALATKELVDFKTR